MFKSKLFKVTWHSFIGKLIPSYEIIFSAVNLSKQFSRASVCIWLVSPFPKKLLGTKETEDCLVQKISVLWRTVWLLKLLSELFHERLEFSQKDSFWKVTPLTQAKWRLMNWALNQRRAVVESKGKSNKLNLSLLPLIGRNGQSLMNHIYPHLQSMVSWLCYYSR